MTFLNTNILQVSAGTTQAAPPPASSNPVPLENRSFPRDLFILGGLSYEFGRNLFAANTEMGVEGHMNILFCRGRSICRGLDLHLRFLDSFFVPEHGIDYRFGNFSLKAGYSQLHNTSGPWSFLWGIGVGVNTAFFQYFGADGLGALGAIGAISLPYLSGAVNYSLSPQLRFFLQGDVEGLLIPLFAAHIGVGLSISSE